MPVFITDKHLKASTTRKTYSDNKQLGFALRSTPNGVFTFYYQHLNKKTGKRDWDVIGTYLSDVDTGAGAQRGHPPRWAGRERQGHPATPSAEGRAEPRRRRHLSAAA
jgi:hypothetical protein